MRNIKYSISLFLPNTFVMVILTLSTIASTYLTEVLSSIKIHDETTMGSNKYSRQSIQQQHFEMKLAVMLYHR